MRIRVCIFRNLTSAGTSFIRFLSETWGSSRKADDIGPDRWRLFCCVHFPLSPLLLPTLFPTGAHSHVTAEKILGYQTPSLPLVTVTITHLSAFGLPPFSLDADLACENPLLHWSFLWAANWQILQSCCLFQPSAPTPKTVSLPPGWSSGQRRERPTARVGAQITRTKTATSMMMSILL